MTSSVATIDPTAPLGEAARLMRDHDVGAVPVQRSGSADVEGILTDRDIVIRCVASRLDPEVTPVDEVMSKDLVYCYDDEDVQGAAQSMEERQVRRILVFGRDDERLKGIMSLGDLSIRARDQEVPAVVLHEVSERREAA
ncbi:MAG: CBS domain-containing protein [Dehalococcoidia bacterium]